MRIDLLRIREAYADHPLPHSIRSLSDTLDELHVSNMVCRLEFGQLFEIEGPFVVKAGEEEYPFFLVESLDRERQVIGLRTVAGRRLEVPFDSFRALWDGTVLLAERGEETKETSVPVYWIRQGLAFLDRSWGYWLVGLCAVLPSVIALRSPDLTDSRFLVNTASSFRSWPSSKPRSTRILCSGSAVSGNIRIAMRFSVRPGRSSSDGSRSANCR